MYRWADKTVTKNIHVFDVSFNISKKDLIFVCGRIFLQEIKSIS